MDQRLAKRANKVQTILVSLFVIILTIANILACLWLLRWTSKPRTASEKIGGGADTITEAEGGGFDTILGRDDDAG